MVDWFLLTGPGLFGVIPVMVLLMFPFGRSRGPHRTPPTPTEKLQRRRPVDRTRYPNVHVDQRPRGRVPFVWCAASREPARRKGKTPFADMPLLLVGPGRFELPTS